MWWPHGAHTCAPLGGQLVPVLTHCSSKVLQSPAMSVLGWCQGCFWTGLQWLASCVGLWSMVLASLFPRGLLSRVGVTPGSRGPGSQEPVVPMRGEV